MATLTSDERQALASLLTSNRWAVLATSHDGEPLAAWVAVAPAGEGAHYLLHLSQLSLHTRHLLANPCASLAFSEQDHDLARDPQTLKRVSLQGRVEIIERGSPDYDSARERYLKNLPHAQIQFSLGDFLLMRFVPTTARFVSGFGRAHRLDVSALSALPAPSD